MMVIVSGVRVQWIAVLAWAFLLLPAQADEDRAHYLANGYGLLYKLCDDEKPLDMILMVKTTPKEVGDFLHQVSKSAAADLADLDQLHDESSAVRFDDRGLPQFELDTRSSIRGDKQHMLLFGTEGNKFVRTILVAQIEASTYGMHLAGVLADAEPNGHRAAVVRKISARWEKVKNRAYALLFAQ